MGNTRESNDTSPRGPDTGMSKSAQSAVTVPFHAYPRDSGCPSTSTTRGDFSATLTAVGAGSGKAKKNSAALYAAAPNRIPTAKSLNHQYHGRSGDRGGGGRESSTRGEASVSEAGAAVAADAELSAEAEAPEAGLAGFLSRADA